LGSVKGDLCDATLQWTPLDDTGSADFTPVNAARSTVTLKRGPGRYLLQFSATKGGATWNDQVAVTWVQNHAPVVDAGPDRILTTQTSAFDIVGTASDDFTSSDLLQYQWTLISAPIGFTISLPVGPTLHVPGGLDEGTYVFKLSVTDTLSAVGT